MMANAPLVLVEWEDSRLPTPHWQWLDTVKATVVRCQSVGFLVQDGAEVKVIAQNVGDSHGADRQISGVMTIPTRAVTRVTRLAAGSGRR